MMTRSEYMAILHLGTTRREDCLCDHGWMPYGLFFGQAI